MHSIVRAWIIFTCLIGGTAAFLVGAIRGVLAAFWGWHYNGVCAALLLTALCLGVAHLVSLED